MMTVVPDLALSGWEDLSPSTPELGQDSSATTSSACKTSGSCSNLSRPWGFASIHFLTPMPAFVPNTSPMPALYGSWQSRRGHVYHVELGYRF